MVAAGLNGLTTSQGLPVNITTKHTESFCGIFAGLETSESVYQIRMVRRLPPKSKDEVNGNEVREDYVGTGPDHSMVFHTSDVLGLAVANVPDVVVSTQNGLQLSLPPSYIPSLPSRRKRPGLSYRRRHLRFFWPTQT